MPCFHGDKSRYLVTMEKINKYGALGYLLFIAALFGSLSTSPQLFNSVNQFLVTIVLSGLILWFAISQYKKRSREARSFYHGLKGEGAIYYELLKLPNNFCVFQDVRLDNIGNIDFVVAGPTGIFTIEVKAHSGEIGFDGTELTRNGSRFEQKDFLKQAYSEAEALRSYLDRIGVPLHIRRSIVFSSSWAKVRFYLKPIHDTFVIQKRYLLKLINSQHLVYSDEEIAKLELSLKTLCTPAPNR